MPHTRNLPLDDGTVGEIVQMALSDHVALTTFGPCMA